ncbi:biotin-dependent carboxyltransferase family protein [Parasedimentitalea huanghaiensis]|uniref:Urea amidolyase n=1 Tax=Parasedimentitalea huanghaiensis TaxID=2682100 RepID=A0A6L6WKY9_9RHOB|nr:biotin-dependent carboxyltransferase family protein [Zongyanglinia huanghaiensis]MVO18091.1 urea amidolyase [Zongyanglinia huanghaiensis]
MSCSLIVHQAGQGMTIQDQGRLGYLEYGLSRGGAADHLAIAEGAALLGQDRCKATLEMAGLGGEFEATEDMRIALTGAPMRASIDGGRIVWNASHALPKGARLSIGGAVAGVYGYLHVGGGLETTVKLGARSAHLAAGLGSPVFADDILPVGSDQSIGQIGMGLEPSQRFDGGLLRIVPSLQTEFFTPEQIHHFETTEFRRDTRGNRMGVRLQTKGAGFQSEAGLSVVSEVIVPGDVQITGDGAPFVLLSECQTTGGYPRIGTVLPADLPRVAQACAGAVLQFKFVSLEDAVEIESRERTKRQNLRQTIQPLIRDPRKIPNLLSYQLISGVTAGDDIEKAS